MQVSSLYPVSVSLSCIVEGRCSKTPPIAITTNSLYPLLEGVGGVWGVAWEREGNEGFLPSVVRDKELWP